MSDDVNFSYIPFIAKKISEVICIFDFDHIQGDAPFEDNANCVVDFLTEYGYDVTIFPIIYKDSLGAWNYLMVNSNGSFENFKRFDRVASIVDAIDRAKKLHCLAPA
jgi:hypothetical protein